MNEVRRVAMGGDGRVYFFLKFLTEMDHVENFMAGNLFLNPIWTYMPKKTAGSDFFYDAVEGAHSINYVTSITLNGRKFEMARTKPGDNPPIFFPGSMEYSHIMSVACVTDHIHKAGFE